MFQIIRRFFMSNVRNRLLLAMLLVSLPPLLGVTAYSIYVAQNLLYEYTQNEQEHRVHTLVLGVERFLSGVSQDVLFLSQSEEIVELLEAQANGDEAAYEEARQVLEREFLAFSQVRGIYYQVRYIDATGTEIARVDSDGSRSFIVSRAQLQNKSGRYYFDDTIVLSQGEVMVSPLDLNIEHGEIQVPFKPVIRYATPVWFEGRAVGIVIINVFADRFLDALGADKGISELVVLVDQDGYYLYHSEDEEKRWGRDLETGITLAQDYPQAAACIAQAVRESDHSVMTMLLDDNFITCTVFSPPDAKYHWTLLSFLPRRVVLAPILWFRWVVTGVLVMSIFVVIALGKWNSDFFVRTAQQLGTQATNIGRGDLETEISLPESYPVEVVALARAFDQARVSLYQIHRDLEEQIARAERRALQLHTVAQVSRAVAEVLDFQELLTRIVVLSSEQFGFYHAGIFLIDDTGEWAVLQAASSPGGQRMLARGHRLRVGEQGIVGYVTATGKPRIALDVGADAVHFINPDLPETRSEVALPLQARGRVLGALDVQSTEKGAFTDDDVTILQTLADQVAIAISNVRLFEQLQVKTKALQRAAGDYSYAAWTEMARSQAGLGYRYSRPAGPRPQPEQAVSPAQDLWRPEMTLAVQSGHTVKSSIDVDGSGGVAIPIRFRDNIIGVIDARKSGDTGKWAAEEIELLETLTDQLSVALESARLYQDTQRRAARERLTAEITARVRETLDVETVLQTAVREVRQALNLPEVVIRLTPPAGQTGDQAR